MALVSSVLAQPAGRIRHPNISGLMARSVGGGGGFAEIVEEPVEGGTVEDAVFIAVGKDVKESKPAVIWAIQNSGGKRICLLHVHVPAQMIPLMGTKFHASSLKDQEVRAYREIERQSMLKTLDEYVLLCRRMGMQAETLYIEMDPIEKGIIELISQHKIRKLVMGAAADKHHSRKMLDLRSKKAILVRQQAPGFCQIHFICKGYLIHTRASDLNGADVDTRPLVVQPNPSTEIGKTNQLRSQSVNLGLNNQTNLTSLAEGLFRRVRSANNDKLRGSVTDVSSLDGSKGLSHSRNIIDDEAGYDVWVGLQGGSGSPYLGSGYSTCSSTPMASVAFVPYMRNKRSETGSEITSPSPSVVDHTHLSPPSVLDGSIDETLYDHVEHAFAEAENAKREALNEAVRRGKAEKEAIDAIRRAKATEMLYGEELKRRKEIKEALAKETEELDIMKRQQDEVMAELRAAQTQTSMLESQIAEADESLKTLEQKFFSAVELLQNYKREREELQIERDKALKEAEELRREHGEGTSSHVPQFFSEFSFSEIEEATNRFNLSLKIGEGGYGSIYKGLLRR